MGLVGGNIARAISGILSGHSGKDQGPATHSAPHFAPFPPFNLPPKSPPKAKAPPAKAPPPPAKAPPPVPGVPHVPAPTSTHAPPKPSPPAPPSPPASAPAPPAPAPPAPPGPATPDPTNTPPANPATPSSSSQDSDGLGSQSSSAPSASTPPAESGPPASPLQDNDTPSSPESSASVTEESPSSGDRTIAAINPITNATTGATSTSGFPSTSQSPGGQAPSYVADASGHNHGLSHAALGFIVFLALLVLGGLVFCIIRRSFMRRRARTRDSLATMIWDRKSEDMTEKFPVNNHRDLRSTRTSAASPDLSFPVTDAGNSVTYPPPTAWNTSTPVTLRHSPTGHGTQNASNELLDFQASANAPSPRVSGNSFDFDNPFVSLDDFPSPPQSSASSSFELRRARVPSFVSGHAY